MVQALVRRFLTSFAFVLSAAFAVAAAGGCEALVPDTVPAFGCTGTSASACPASQICAPTLGKCVDRSHACTIVDGMCANGTHCDPGTQMCVPDDMPDASPGVDADGGPPPHDAPPPPVDSNMGDGFVPPPDSGKCTTVGCSCTRNADCDSDICADTNILTSADTMGKFCTKPCCQSSECPAEFVCFAPGTGGNYCVPKTMLGRATLGAAPGGATCSADETCRSGKCGSGGRCLDACCTTGSTSPGTDTCAAGSECALDMQTGHTVLQCNGSSGTHFNGYSCSVSSSCYGNACEPDPTSSFGDECMVPCCGSPGCGSGFACFDQSQVGSNDWYPLCSQPTGTDIDGQTITIGAMPLGATCTLNRDCRSARCLGGKCTDVCCTDSDCAAVAGWICQPTAVTGGTFLRCGAPL